MELIFVHTPKTGGSSVCEAIHRKFGDKLHRDYGDRPTDPDSPMHADRRAFLAVDHGAKLKGKSAVAGHFWICKYRTVLAGVRATVLRDPVDRLISNYCYWKWARVNPAVVSRNSVRRRFHTDKPTLVEFASYPMSTGFYRECYFPETDMSCFDYIADYRDLSDNWAAVMSHLDLPTEPILKNRTASLSADYGRERSEFLADHRAVSTVRNLLAEEIRFYETWAQRI